MKQVPVRKRLTIPTVRSAGPTPLVETRAIERWVGPNHLYVEGREPVSSQPGKLPILFTGGAFDGSWIFRREIEYLSARGWPTYALNLRGYYKSRYHNVASLTVDDYLDDIRTVREELKLKHVILAGYSMGGVLSLKHAEVHGADGVILYDSDPSKEVCHDLGFHPDAGHIESVMQFWPSIEIVREMWGGAVSRRRYEEFLELFKQTYVSGQAYCVLESGNLSVNTWNVRCPALVIGIRRDERVQAEWFKRLNATWLVFEGNSHGSILVGPKSMSITREVARWLDTTVVGHVIARRQKIFPVLGYTSPGHHAYRMQVFYFSGWDKPEVEIKLPGRQPAVRVKMDKVDHGRESGENLFETTVTLPHGAGFFVRQGHLVDRPPAGEVYRPVASTIYLADGEFFPYWPPTGRTKPTYLDIDVYCHELQHMFRVHLMAPRNYRPDTRPYPVCVLNDGQNQWKNQGANGGWHTDAITNDLMRKGRCRDVFLVSVESLGLSRNKCYLTPPIGRGDLYASFLADVLLPYLRRNFNISNDPGDIGIVGSSYGANCAVYVGLKRPDVFGLVGSMSYAPLRGKPLRSWMERLPNLPFRKLYVDTGTRWDHNPHSKRSDNTGTTLDFIRIAHAKGMAEGRTILSWVARDHTHSEVYWRKRIGRCMEFLFSLI